MIPNGLVSDEVMERPLIRKLKSTECKIFFHFLCFRIVFVLCFAAMFAMLFAAVIGMTFGVIMAIFGTAVLLFRADFIISGIAPEIMLFGGLTAVFLALFLGMLAVKLGFIVSRYYLRTRRHCDNLRERDREEEWEYPDDPDDPDDSVNSDNSDNSDSSDKPDKPEAEDVLPEKTDNSE